MMRRWFFCEVILLRMLRRLERERWLLLLVVELGIIGFLVIFELLLLLLGMSGFIGVDGDVIVVLLLL